MREPSRFLKDIVELSREAGGEILKIYHSNFRVAEKDDHSPLTAADLVSHQRLLRGLESLAAVYPVLSEESAAVPYAERQAWETYWLIDPLDGTREFVKRNGEFTVNVALVHQGKPVLGVVHAPVLGASYFAAEGCGAFVQRGDDLPHEIAVRSPAPARITVVGSRSHWTPGLEAYLERLGGYELRSMGSSLKFCLVAEGMADLYPRLGPTSEWDTAAAQCVVEEAGGAVVDLDGEPLRYNGKESLLNPYFLVYGDKSRDWREYSAGLRGAATPRPARHPPLEAAGAQRFAPL